ncbi:MAG: plasmid mobilization protein [Rhodanobacteraceae bacterium]
MAATERVVILMSKAQKHAVESRARAARLGVGAYMRRQALGEGGDEEAVLGALAKELKASNARAVRALDDAVTRLETTKRKWPELEAAARRRAELEFAELAKATRP